jgi:MoxR-like ATPase
VEHHGTYPLPESQLDRFLMRISIGYPDEGSEREILRQSATSAFENVRAVISSSELVLLQEAVARIPVDEALLDYILAIVKRTRAHESLSMGVSPRGAQGLYRAAQAMAAVEGRDYVTPDDVKRMVVPVFAHRVALNVRTISGSSSGAAEKILEEILTFVDVPL